MCLHFGTDLHSVHVICPQLDFVDCPMSIPKLVPLLSRTLEHDDWYQKLQYYNPIQLEFNHHLRNSTILPIWDIQRSQIELFIGNRHQPRLDSKHDDWLRNSLPCLIICYALQESSTVQIHVKSVLGIPIYWWYRAMVKTQSRCKEISKMAIQPKEAWWFSLQKNLWRVRPLRNREN